MPVAGTKPWGEGPGARWRAEGPLPDPVGEETHDRLGQLVRVVADDVRYSIERSLNPALRSPSAPTYLIDIAGAYEYVTGKAKSVSGVKVVDSHTVRITTRWAVPYFLMELTYPTSYVLDAKLLKSNPVDDIARLVALYQDGRLKLRELVTRTYALDDVNQALNALAAGEGARGVIKMEG